MRNTLPPLQYAQLLEDSLAGPMGISVEGSNASVPGDDQYHALSSDVLTLPPIDPYGPAARWIDIYSRATESFPFQITPNVSWVKVTPSSGFIYVYKNGSTTDLRVNVSVDWDNAPLGSSLVSLNITIPNGTYPTGDWGHFYSPPVVQLPVNKTVVPSSFHGFVESDGVVSIEAQHATRNTSTANVSYAVIPGYGRTLSGVTLLPVNAPSQEAPSSPRLEYDMYLFSPAANGSTVNITLYLGPSLNVDPDRPLRYALSFDDDDNFQTVQYVPSTVLGTYPADWPTAVSNNVWTSKTSYLIRGFNGNSSDTEGTGSAHTLKLWALEPGVVFEKIVIDFGGERHSYLGPPESRIV
ncbi:hypothetical protein VTN77DRAFT_6921 [Rasamsonia byssochlamydoides]|uniref:uncharacterized protein n=1 Tax=Rasamsonia byssochlamydoides TaxID=89139 RepID=UPI0037441F8F